MENVDFAEIESFGTMALPRFMVLESVYNNKYLNYLNEEGEMHAFLKFSGEEVVSPYAKFELEMAQSWSGQQQQFHIRSCYNNKYWRMKAEDDWYVVAAGDQPEEDRSKWSCTLFEAISVDETAQTWRFRHVFRGAYASMRRGIDPRWFSSANSLYLESASANSDLRDVYKIINWETLTILPKHVAFKGDNGKYLKSWWGENHEYLKFDGDDIGDERVGNEVFTNGDGTIRIKLDHFNKFWRRSPNWIWTDSTDTTSNNVDTLFQPVKVGNNVIALRNLGNNYFCKRLSVDRKENCLNAAVPTISNEARLEVEELILSSSIYHINYRVADARIYDQIPVVLREATVNNAKDVTDTLTTKLTYKDVKTKSWNSSLSLMASIEASMQIGVPEVSAGKVTMSFEYVNTQSWGETRTVEKEVEVEYAAVVPPRTSVSVKLLATRGLCDVPFSYTQRVTLTNGQQRIEKKDDGVYTGSNYFNFDITATQKSI